MSLKSGQSLKTCVESPFSIFHVASARSERLDELSLTLDNPAGVGNTSFSRTLDNPAGVGTTSFGRRELIVCVSFSAHDHPFADRQTNVLDLNQIRPALA
jgi:hypothetical protein